MKLPRTTWVPGVGPRPDDGWLKEVDADLLVQVGTLLFDRGQGFEAHEVWETAWHSAKAAGRRDDERVLRALIRLAAAMVKVRQCVPRGVLDHARGARLVLDEVGAEVVLGVDVVALKAMAHRIEEDALAGRFPPAESPVGDAMFGRVPRRDAAAPP